MTVDIHQDAITALINGNHGAPSQILGPHPQEDDTISIRAFRPHAHSLTLFNKDDAQRVPMTRIHEAGLFEARVKGDWHGTNYVYEEISEDGTQAAFYDPYAFAPLLSGLDLYLFSEGRNWYIYEKMGAQLRQVDHVTGVNFAVWAPNAERVSVVGDFNNWDGRVHAMQTQPDSSVWEIFIPGLQAGEKYKFEIQSRLNGYRAEKTDPFGYFAEPRPKTASIVADLTTYEWQDSPWMETRKEGDPLNKPMSIYEVHLGSWRRNSGNKWLTYRELADDLVDYVTYMNYTHVELLPVAEHPFDGSWGYQVTGYYAVTSRFGTPEDFMYFVDKCHQAGIGVIIDWVPAHFPKDGHALSYFDGTHLYEHADPRQSEHPDWGTYIFNYGRNEVRNFLISNALFWLKQYHIDGLRVDAVSSMLYLDFGRKEGEWIANEYGSNENLAAIEFMRQANEVIHSEVPGAMTLAEESTAWPMVSRPTYLGGLGFTFKWNMGWMHDTLEYMQTDPIYRSYHHNKLTFSLMYAFSENFVLSLSHDEVVHGKGSMMGKMAGDWWQKFASLRLLAGYQMTHPGKKLTFMGQEIGQWREWSEERSLDWHLVEEFEMHQKLQAWVRDLNGFYASEPAMYEQDYGFDGFQWIEANDSANSVYSYIRYAADRRNFLVVVANFTPVPHADYRVGVPEMGYYSEVLNSDAAIYGGSNTGSYGGRHADYIAWHGFNQSVGLVLPPLGVVILKIKRTME